MPFALVVKNGSKILSKISGETPIPVSLTQMLACVGEPSITSFSIPFFGIESSAFKTRFNTA